MYAIPEPISAASKANVEALLTMAQTQFTAFERLTTLNSTTIKSAFEDSLNQAKALLSAQDAQEFAQMTAARTQPALERAIAYSRGLYEVAMQTQIEVTKVADSQAAETNKTVATVLETITKSAPPGSEIGLAAVKLALVANNTVFDTFSKVVKQANAIAEENVIAASATAVNEAGKRKAA